MRTEKKEPARVLDFSETPVDGQTKVGLNTIKTSNPIESKWMARIRDFEDHKKWLKKRLTTPC